jgi:hypothetical protein
MSRLARALLIVSLSCAINGACAHGAQIATQKQCTPDEAVHALDEADGLKDWDAVYRSFKTFGHCGNNGALAEIYDDDVVRLLANNWNHFDALIRLVANDKGFEGFVLSHISETANYDDLIAAKKNAGSLCPPGQNPLCERIESSVSSLLSDTHPFLGILEDVPGGRTNEPNFRAVRVLFQKNGNEWQPFHSDCRDAACLKATAAQYPREMAWTIAFDGKNLGKITTRAPLEFKLYADVGLEVITSAGSVPSVGKRSQNYAGFAHGEVYRPLVAVSQPNYTDPEVWKPGKLPDEMTASLRQQFRKKFPNVSNCTNPDKGIRVPWLYRDEDIAIGKTYGSRKKWFVAELRLEGWRCDSLTDENGPFGNQWYVVDPAGIIRFLDSGMWLVDAGDYDNDGKSELVFAINRYGVGGYELFYDEFTKHAVFEFSYH